MLARGRCLLLTPTAADSPACWVQAAWNAHGVALDRLVGFDGKGGAMRRKALRAMVRSVEMGKDQPAYWQTLGNLHRKMHSWEEAFDALEHFARLSVARADAVEAEREALT